MYLLQKKVIDKGQTITQHAISPENERFSRYKGTKHIIMYKLGGYFEYKGLKYPCEYYGCNWPGCFSVIGKDSE